MGTYSYTGSAQFVTVTTGGIYDITAFGAQGGSTSKSGGLGAYVGGDVILTAGEKLEIIVGGKGTTGTSYSPNYGGAGGGGGGTFVLKVNGSGSYTPLLIAGGGGGAGTSRQGGAANSAMAANGAGKLGGGGGASVATYVAYGGGGAGLNGNGTTSPGYGGGGFNRSGNYAGGSAGNDAVKGGFGGGGGGAGIGGGGGGGYSGGNGGNDNSASTGGSSFVASTLLGFSIVRQSGVQTGNGTVSISPAAGTPGTPTTSSIYDTSAGTSATAATVKAGKTFGFSFTTENSAAAFSTFQIALDNPGGGSGSVSFYLESNSSSNTPGTKLLTLSTENDSQISGATLGSGSGQNYELAANTQYWLVGVNSASSNITEAFDNASPGVGYADEYQYDSAYTTTASFANGSTPIDGKIVVIACYVSGTLIRTNRGEMPVEILAIGDTVVTAAGQHRPIKWLGRRSYAGRFLAANPNVQPIRFRAGSLGGGLPRRDLLVSPDHAMALDGLLVPARCLVNGATIVRERGLRRVEYHHVELDSHDVLLAEGAPSESFMDDSSRGLFRNAHEFAAMYPDAPAPGGFCAPRVESGFQLEAIRARLAAVSRELALAA